MMKDKPGRVIFVGATDTGVGKTLVCALLVDYWRRQGVEVGYLKWVATGGEDGPPEDWRVVASGRNRPAAQATEELPGRRGRRPLSPDDPISADDANADWRCNPELAIPYHFRLAASPHLAAEAEGREIDPRRLKTLFQQARARHEVLVVEGVGGLLVPLTRHLLLLDLVAELQIPTLLVARSGLGTINHTLLSLEALIRRQVPLLGLLCSDEAPDLAEIIVNDNLRTLEQLGRTKVLGRLPRLTEFTDLARSFSGIAAELDGRLA